ncbi:flagellar basal-body rod protein FlgG [Pleionea sediminis]|uniref:flagellar basal-body rod protein FlgG n=1 Tax=Pleionea sediminis TaxID=2569479 RepID=UPI001185B094|nr:flagellar basal-body rod protein FlgG [Pleionea sediminis]
MINALYIAETGLNAQKSLVDVISNNIANVNTSGFKKSKIDFVDLMYGPEKLDTKKNTTESNDLKGVHIASISQDMTAGKLKYTEHPFDVAIQGEGMIAVEYADGEIAYTRIGRLRVDNEGYLSTAQGHRLEANIGIPPDLDGVIFAPDGMVKGVINGESDLIDLGQIDLVRFNNQQGLNAVGEGLYVETEESGTNYVGRPGDEGFGKILQGYTEESNVSMVEEMVNLVIAQRGYQLNARVIQVSDQLLETVNNLRR